MAEKAVLLQQTLVGTIYYRVSMIAAESCISLALDRLDVVVSCLCLWVKGDILFTIVCAHRSPAQPSTTDTHTICLASDGSPELGCGSRHVTCLV